MDFYAQATRLFAFLSGMKIGATPHLPRTPSAKLVASY